MLVFVYISPVKEKENNLDKRAHGKQAPNSTIITQSPGDFHGIASQLNNNTPRMKMDLDPRCAQVPYTNYNPYFTHQFAYFQRMQTLQSQHTLQNGVDRIGVTQANPFMHPSYMAPIHTVGNFHFSQINNHSNEAYNAFTAYGNPFGVVWRQN